MHACVCDISHPTPQHMPPLQVPSMLPSTSTTSTRRGALQQRDISSHHHPHDAVRISSSSFSSLSQPPPQPTPPPQQDHLYRVRERQWIYLGPIAAAPLAHIGVTLYGSSWNDEKKRGDHRGKRNSSSNIGNSSTRSLTESSWMRLPSQTTTKRTILVGGIAATTILTIGMRLYLMVHAGYPGGPNPQMADREHFVTRDEKYKMEHASTMEIAKAAAKGFG